MYANRSRWGIGVTRLEDRPRLHLMKLRVRRLNRRRLGSVLSWRLMVQERAGDVGQSPVHDIAEPLSALTRQTIVWSRVIVRRVLFDRQPL